jgi:hypothetical protein
MRRPARPTGFTTTTVSGSEDGGFASPSSNVTAKSRRQRASTMLKQDSIAEESVSRSSSPCPPHITSSTTAIYPVNTFPVAPQSRNPSAGSQISECVQQQMSPRLDRSRSRLATYSPTKERKGSLSPNTCPTSSHSLFNTTPNASTKRKGFQRATSAAQSDVTDLRPVAVLEPNLHGCVSCENTSKIRFDICSSAGSSLRNSNSSSLYCRNAVTSNTLLPVPGTLVSGNGPSSLKANGFVPKTPMRDPFRWHLSITKQRSQSESAFNTTKLLLPSNSPGSNYSSYHHDAAGILTAVRMGGGGSSSLSGCPANRRCSMTILNPHKEQAILRRILGPSALDWLKEKNNRKSKESRK